MRHTLYCDGASRGNPGPASIGAVLYDPRGAPLAEISESIGYTTNNVAEYRALIAGLEKARALGVADLLVRLDSQLLVRQISGEYRVKASGLKPLHRRIVELIARFARITIEHIPREENLIADRLANDALDE